MRSIYNKVHLLEHLLQEKKDIQVICITETWLNEEKLRLIQVNNFNIESNFCRKNHMGGGVCIFIKKCIECFERLDIKSLSSETIVEVCAIEVPKANLLIVNLYWPNGNQTKKETEDFYTRLEKLLKLLYIKDCKKDIIIGGDFNVNFLSNDNTKKTLSDLMLVYNFRQMVKEPTRVTSHSATCIDVIFTNFTNKNTLINVQDLGLSDHKGVFISTPLFTPKINFFFKTKRNFTETNMMKFKCTLQTINWNEIFDANSDIDENYIKFNDILQKILNNCIPKKLVKIYVKSKKTYITPGLKISCRNKRSLKLFISQTKSKILRNYYKTYCKILKRAVFKSRKLNNIRHFEKSCNKIRTTWRIINNETNKIPSINKNVELKMNNLQILKEPKGIANLFNSFFASVGNIHTDSQQKNRLKNILENTFFLKEPNEKEVKQIIQNLKNKSSMGIDEIPPTLIKKCTYELITPYTKLIGQSFTEGQFPDMLKISLIKPIYKKKGDSTDPNSYRPIALLPTSAKIFEAAMANRLYAFYEKFFVFHKNQHGFRQKHSTTLAIYEYVQKILDAINNSKYAVGLLLDMSKAYDRVRHSTLLDKLYETGIRGTTHKWFKSYFENRKQYVEIENTNFNTGRIENIRSEEISMKGSIPQGSVLGCILFLIYINDFPHELDDQCTLFADDISVIVPCSNTNELNNKLDFILNRIHNWLECNNLKLNLNKTKLIQFKPSQKVPLPLNYNYNKQKLTAVDTATLLGLDLDTNMDWKSFVRNLTNKLSSFTYALRHLKRVTDFKSALAAYYAYCHSRLSYGVIIWGNSTNVNDVFVVQKKCVRILTSSKQTDSCKPLFKKLGILTLTDIYIFESCKFVRNHPTSFTPKTGNKRNNRDLHQLQVQFSKLKLVCSGPQNMVTKVYNHIPTDLKETKDFKIFSKRLKEFLLNKNYYSVKEFLEDEM